MRDFIHLHLHSAYSLAEGAIPVDRLAKLCEVSEMPAVAVTDTNNLFGALDVSETLSGRGIQPIIGIQLDFSHPCLVDDLKNDRGGLVLLAQNELGYENLMALASDAYLNAPVEIGPCADFSWLNKRSEGLLCLTGGFDGLISALIDAVKVDEARAALEDLARVFGDRLYVELQRHADRSVVHYEDVLLNFAYENRAGVVATNEPFFPTRADYDAHDALICIAQGAYVYQDERRRLTSDHYFKNADEMAALFSDIPEAISSTIEIAHRCAFRPQTRDPILPRFTALNSANADENETDTEELELKRQAEDGLAARLKEIELAAPEEAYWERLKVELSIINKMGFPGYFLIVADFIKWAKKEGIPVGPGRGSGAGSLVAYALTVTDLDPLRFGLLFERFLNPERVSMPDFDVDFCQERRDEVIEYVQGKYGRDRVAQIITFGKLQARAVLRDVGRVLGMPFGQVDRLCKLVPNNPANPVTLQQAVELEPKLQEERSKDSSVELLITTALKLEGLYRHASTHAAGVVIGDRPLEQLAPLYIDPRSDMPATQFNMRWVELAGLVKFDFLGLKTLTVIDRAVALAASMSVSIDVHALPLNDEKTFGLLGEGDAVGVFQLESPGMRATLKSMKPDSLDDV
ncbi:MAG: DNA polymerase III subunit alpha, partial [Pseudomonadota bacterium]